MLRIIPPSIKPVNNLICCETDLMWVSVKRYNIAIQFVLQQSE